MKIKKNTDYGIFSSMETGLIRNNQKEKNKSIFAGRFNVNESPMNKKRKDAQEKALKIVSNVLKKEKKIEDDLQVRKDHINKLYQNMKSAKEEIGKIEANKVELKKNYGIDDNSEEQKDLELLEKRRDSLEIGSTISLTKEEKERLSKIDNVGMTEYQTRSLQMDNSSKPLKKELKESKKLLIEENAIIRSMKLERLKSSPMVDAVKAADTILDEASNEIKGMLLNEAKEQIDDKVKEKQEEAEKKANEKEKQQDELDALKEKKETMESYVKKKDNDISASTLNRNMPMDDFLEITHIENDSKKDVDKIIVKMKLVEEDMKGIVVDSKL